MKQFSLIFVGITLAISSISISTSKVHASNEIIDITGNAQHKKQLVQFLSQRLKKHEQMSLTEIKNDLIGSLESNRTHLQYHGDLNTSFSEAVDTTISHISRFDRKDKILNAEHEMIQHLVSSHNYTFGFTKEVVKSTQPTTFENFFGIEDDSRWVNYFGLVFSVPIDFVVLPYTFYKSIVTGF